MTNAAYGFVLRRNVPSSVRSCLHHPPGSLSRMDKSRRVAGPARLRPSFFLSTALRPRHHFGQEHSEQEAQKVVVVNCSLLSFLFFWLQLKSVFCPVISPDSLIHHRLPFTSTLLNYALRKNAESRQHNLKESACMSFVYVLLSRD